MHLFLSFATPAAENEFQIYIIMMVNMIDVVVSPMSFGLGLGLARCRAQFLVQGWHLRLRRWRCSGSFLLWEQVSAFPYVAEVVNLDQLTAGMKDIYT